LHGSGALRFDHQSIDCVSNFVVRGDTESPTDLLTVGTLCKEE
jgi:hypothetical protein